MGRGEHVDEPDEPALVDNAEGGGDSIESVADDAV